MLERLLLPVVGVALLLTDGAAQAQRSNDLVSQRVTAQVVAVIDGDTVDILIPPARRVRVRLHGVDTPEIGEPFYQEARVFTRVLMFSRTVVVSGKDADVYGRLVARISVDGNDASEAIIAAGLGCTFRRYISDPLLDAALSRARAARRGFWAAETRQPACAAREAQAQSAASTGEPAAATRVIGNTNSKVYHRPDCPNAGCRSCTRTFASPSEADAAGFRPAGDCIRR
jgi:endonuclease YncB( thermonuclease family)